MSAAGELLDLAVNWGDSLLRLFTVHARDHRLQEKLEDQLCLKRGPLTRLFADGVVAELAVTGSDPFVVEVSDVTLIFRLKKPDVFQKAADEWLEQARTKYQGLEERTFNYRGHKIAARYTDDRVVSSFKGGYYGASYEWDFVRGSRGYLGALIGARMLDIDALVSAPDKGVREINQVRTFAPALGVATRLYAGRMSLESEFAGMSMGSRGSLWEFEISGRAHIPDRLAVEGGYRSIKLKGEDGPDNGDILLKGWNFGLELSL